MIIYQLQRYWGEFGRLCLRRSSGPSNNQKVGGLIPAYPIPLPNCLWARYWTQIIPLAHRCTVWLSGHFTLVTFSRVETNPCQNFLLVVLWNMGVQGVRQKSNICPNPFSSEQANHDMSLKYDAIISNSDVKLDNIRCEICQKLDSVQQNKTHFALFSMRAFVEMVLVLLSFYNELIIQWILTNTVVS